jgi:hypothetical protein
VSYDLYVVPREEAARWVDFLESRVDEGDVVWSEGEGTRAERVAAALLALDPQLERLSAPDERGFVELDHQDTATPIEVWLYPDNGSLTIPYWHSGEQARVLMRKVFDYLEAIERESGWVCVDPQLDRPLDRATDLDEVVAAYESGTVAVRRSVEADERPRLRRIWPFRRDR